MHWLKILIAFNIILDISAIHLHDGNSPRRHTNIVCEPNEYYCGALKSCLSVFQKCDRYSLNYIHNLFW